MKTLRLLLTLGILTLVFSCSSDTYSTAQGSSAPVAFVYFSGNIQGAMVSIDNAEPFAVNLGGIKNQYQITPGKHTITITRNGETIVKRSVMIGNGHEKEFIIP